MKKRDALLAFQGHFSVWFPVKLRQLIRKGRPSPELLPEALGAQPLENGFRLVTDCCFIGYNTISVSPFLPHPPPRLLLSSSQQFGATVSQEALRQQNSGLGREYPQGRSIVTTRQALLGKEDVWHQHHPLHARAQ